MPIHMRETCTGSIYGDFRGAVTNDLTASYDNNGLDSLACTGSLLVQSYTLSTGSLMNPPQANHGDRLYIRMSGSNLSGDSGRVGDATKWCLIKGATEAWEEVNSVAGETSIVMDEVTYIPGATVFLSASNANNAMNYKLPTPRLGLKYTFMSNCSGAAGVDVKISAPTTSTLTAQVDCKDGRVSDTFKTNLKFSSAAWQVGDKVECVSDGTSWFINAMSDAEKFQVSID